MAVPTDRLLNKAKQSKLLRLLASPYKNWKITSLYNKYLKSEDRQRLEQLKDTHKGERCFIVGNGPSLRSEDLEKLTHEFTFASNRIYEIFDKTTWRPTVYLAVDEVFCCQEYDNLVCVQCELKLLPFKWFSKHKALKEKLGANVILTWVGDKKFKIGRSAGWAERSAYIPENIALGFSEGHTVTFEAIQMAVHMGFSEIYLLGVDFNYSRVIDENGAIKSLDGVTTYFNHKEYSTSLLYYVPAKRAYEVSREYCDAHGITIKNATRGGKLDVLERADFDSLLAKNNRLGQ